MDAHVADGKLEILACNGGDCIAKEYLLKIFQPYWRPITSKLGGGLGLGLYICFEIGRAHSGELTATSNSQMAPDLPQRSESRAIKSWPNRLTHW